MQINHPFVGHALNAVDAKGRVSVPSAFRSAVDLRIRSYGVEGDEAKATELMIGVHPASNRLVAYDRVGIRQLIEQLTDSVADLPPRERREELTKLRRSETGSLSPVSYDSAGRMVLSPEMRRGAKLGEQALFLSVVDYFEIWDPYVAREALADDPATQLVIDGYLAPKAGA